jgi:peptidoglycan/xylan/chitin deacetylase (PgdA/CDA1 family)
LIINSSLLFLRLRRILITQEGRIMKNKALLLASFILLLITIALPLVLAQYFLPSPPPAPPATQPARPLTPITARFAVPVLMYHRVCDLTPREARSPLMCDLTVSPADFAEQMQYLVDNHFTILSVNDIETAIYNHLPLPERAVVITLDDGYKDNFDYALPILQRCHTPATIFLVTSVVGAPDHLCWDNARAMLQQDINFESHTVHHYDLTTLPNPLLISELRDARNSITQHLNTPVTQVAYPSGMYNNAVVTAAQFTGYRAGWKKGGGPVRPDDDPYLLPRIRVHGRTTMEDFKRKVWSGVYAIREEQAAKNG